MVHTSSRGIFTAPRGRLFVRERLNFAQFRFGVLDDLGDVPRRRQLTELRLRRELLNIAGRLELARWCDLWFRRL